MTPELYDASPPEDIYRHALLACCFIPRAMARRWMVDRRITLPPWCADGHVVPPASGPASQPTLATLRQAPVATIHAAIGEVYAEAIASRQRAPNIKNIAVPVIQRLRAAGLSTSGNLIRRLASDGRYASSRQPGGRPKKPPR